MNRQTLSLVLQVAILIVLVLVAWQLAALSADVHTASRQIDGMYWSNCHTVLNP